MNSNEKSNDTIQEKQKFILKMTIVVVFIIFCCFCYVLWYTYHEPSNPQLAYAPLVSESLPAPVLEKVEKPSPPKVPQTPFSMYLETKVHIYDELGRILPNAYATIGLDEDNFNELRNRYGNFSLAGDAVRTIISTTDFEENVDVNEPAFQHLILWNFKDVPYSFNEKDYLLKVISLHLPEGYEEDKSQPMTKTSSSLYMDAYNPKTKNALIEFKIYTKKMK